MLNYEVYVTTGPVTTSSQGLKGCSMRTRIAAIGVVGVLLTTLSSVAAAQPRTTPATIDVTCHGYDEGATLAYNCIPVASQQHLLATFVPAVGSACNGGQVAEFPPGRIVFQIRCDDTGTGAPPTTPMPAGWTASGRGPNFFTKPINAVRVRIRSSFSGSSANFIVWCRTPSNSLVVNELIGSRWDNNGTEGVYRMANCTEVEVSTDQNAQWWLSQESGTAFTPPRSWTSVTGTEGDLSVDALAALAKAIDIERSVPVEVLSGPFGTTR